LKTNLGPLPPCGIKEYEGVQVSVGVGVGVSVSSLSSFSFSYMKKNNNKRQQHESREISSEFHKYRYL
jgi:hypothetical protein